MILPIVKNIMRGVVVFALCAAPCFAQSDSNDNDDITELDEVVVESSKTDRTYLETNNSVQIVPAKKLEDANIEAVRDLNKIVPGLTIENRGTSSAPSTTLRGISSPDYYSPSLSIYVDGVLQDTAFAMQELVNVKSVEILKGPQGSLYGGNSHGGIINIVTYKGSEDPYAQVSLSQDSIKNTTSATLGTPIGGGFSADLSLFSQSKKGKLYITDLQRSEADESFQTGVTGGLYYKPQEGPFSASLKIKYDELDAHDELYITEKEFKDKKTAAGNFFVNPAPQADRDLVAITAQMAYRISDTLTLESTTGVQNRKLDQFFFGGTAIQDQDQFSQELRLKSTAKSGPTYVLGLYYETKKFKTKTVAIVPQIPGGLFIKNNAVNVKSTAVFGDVNIPVGKSFDVSLGLRYGVDESDVDYFSPFPPEQFKTDRSDNILLPKLAFGFKLSETAKLFASASAGYKPSGFNYLPSGAIENAGYDAELSRNYELGLKTKSSDNRFIFNTALYFIELEKTQIFVGQTPFQILTNLGNAESRGIELDTSYAYSNDRDEFVTFGAAWGKAEYTSGNEKQNLKGKRLQYSPETTANIGWQGKLYDQGLPGKILLGVNGRFTSKLYYSEANTKFLSQDDHSVFDAHLRYKTKSGSFVQLFAKNLTDTIYSTYKFEAFGLPDAYGVWGDRRTYGISGTAVF